ncbi:hypothetical protein [Lunatibacter salilacus]|uniref:hypothetical protein n=1 Tax=Lunatibacter salilacus TaxID=2483804 RepID=UPI00131AFCA1|nr:hypothetical protein [Lunatibacter salilacus]
MKKSLLIFAFVLTAALAQAQEKGDARLQLGGEFGFNSELFGLNIGAEYFVVDRISAAPNFTIFFPDYGSASNLNVDFRYYLTEGILQWYGLAGFTNHWASVDFGSSTITSSTQGANIGAGGVLKFADRLAFNPEIKYQAMSGGQAVFRLGLVYFIN